MSDTMREFNEKIVKEFNDLFAGKEVSVETTKSKRVIGDKEYEFEDHDFAQNNAILERISKLAQERGLRTRYWLPDTLGTMDFRTDRLNIHVDKDDKDGKWKVQSFNIG